MRGGGSRAAGALFLVAALLTAHFVSADRDTGSASSSLGHKSEDVTDNAQNSGNVDSTQDHERVSAKTLTIEADTGSGICQPSLPVYHMIFKLGEGHFIRSGAPAKTSAPMSDLTVLRSCQRWSTQSSCCTDEFFGQVGKIWDAEAKRFQAIRDYYQFVVADVVQPAIAALEDNNEVEVAAKVTKVSESLAKGSAMKTVREYIDKCEDSIRLFFGATLCEVCDPALDTNLADQRVLRVESDGCTVLHTSCKDMPERLRESAKVFSDAATQIRRAAAGLPQGAEAFSEVRHAAGTLGGTSAAIDSVATAIDFYKDRDKLCDLVEAEGYAYRPEVWGNIDNLHPGAQQRPTAQKTKQAPSEELETGRDTAMEALNKRLKIVEDGAMEGFEVPSLPPQKYGVKAPTSCEHGGLVRKAGHMECACSPCWTGNRCEIPLENRAVMKQRFRALTSDPQAQPQSITIMGCNMFDAAHPLQSLMTHVKFVNSGPLTDKEEKSLASSELASKDRCLVRSSAPGFGSMLTQVPVSVLKQQVEFLVHVPASEDATPKRYTVCVCYGPECLEELAELSGKVINHQFQEKDALSWYTAGHVNVLHPSTLHHQSKAELALMARLQGDGPSRQDASGVKHGKPTRPCGEQWAFGDLSHHGITAKKLQGDMIAFGCLKGFTDLQGARWLRCIDGTWFEPPEEDGADTEALSAWKQHLPYCRWKFSTCQPPALTMEGGTVSVNAGMARYACSSPLMRLTIGGKPVEAASFVRWCTEKGDWTPKEVPTCTQHDQILHLPSSLKNMTSVVPQSSLVELGAQERKQKRVDEENAVTMTKLSEENAKLSDENASLPIGLSFVELSASSHQTLRSANRGTSRSSSHTSRDGVETSTRASAKVAAEDFSDGQTVNSASSQEERHRSSGVAAPAALRIHPWQIKFTDDNSHYFSVDKCWITWSCATDQIPDDAAASPFYAYSPALHETSYSWLFMTACAVSIVVPVAMMSVVVKGSKSEPSTESD